MPIMWIGDVLPKIMEQDAGRGYCYAMRNTTWINQSRIEDQCGGILTRQGQPRNAAG